MRGKGRVSKVSIIAAMDSVRGIGRGGKLMWHISEDMKHFKEVTSGHTVIMGRKTFESIGRALPNRVNIVVTKNRDFRADGCNIVNSLEEALALGEKDKSGEIFIIGGGEIYRQAMPFANKLYLTIVEGDFGADTFFPSYENFGKIVSVKESQEDGLHYKFVNIEKNES